ncbi:unnamed protein product [Lupinus luteus]|uniref:Uncharacterized protein n=1 Tax=Lupinus luteus TaxID=3873 RepID=A0AAV1YHC9_LUPLU
MNVGVTSSLHPGGPSLFNEANNKTSVIKGPLLLRKNVASTEFYLHIYATYPPLNHKQKMLTTILLCFAPLHITFLLKKLRYICFNILKEAVD